MLTPSNAVVVKRSPGKGRGVFARRPIRKGEVIETAPTLKFPATALTDGLKNQWLGNYYFWWDKKTVVLALGFGSLYNHSSRPNAEFTVTARKLSFEAVRNIEEGEEITINYRYDAKEMKRLNFRD